MTASAVFLMSSILTFLRFWACRREEAKQLEELVGKS